MDPHKHNNILLYWYRGDGSTRTQEHTVILIKRWWIHTNTRTYCYIDTEVMDPHEHKNILLYWYRGDGSTQTQEHTVILIQRWWIHTNTRTYCLPWIHTKTRTYCYIDTEVMDPHKHNNILLYTEVDNCFALNLCNMHTNVNKHWFWVS